MSIKNKRFIFYFNNGDVRKSNFLYKPTLEFMIKEGETF